MSELSKRIIVAAIGIPAAVALLYSGGVIFLCAVIIISATAQWEYYIITEKKGFFPIKRLGISTGISLQVVFYIFYSKGGWFGLFGTLMILAVLFVILTMALSLWRKHGNATAAISTTFAGVIYIPFLLLSLIILRNLQPITSTVLLTGKIEFAEMLNILNINRPDWGAWLLLSVFAGVWVCDSAAFFVGKAIGKRKLFPRHSPKKTWEGAISGFFGGIIGFALTMYIMVPMFPVQNSIVIGVIIGIFGQIGDLAESQLKRDASVKDSSAILPGHGGALDRFDSILFVAPIVLVYLLIAIM